MKLLNKWKFAGDKLVQVRKDLMERAFPIAPDDDSKDNDIVEQVKKHTKMDISADLSDVIATITERLRSNGILYADDLMIKTIISEVNKALIGVNVKCREFGLPTNWAKTEILRINESAHGVVHRDELGLAEEFKDVKVISNSNGIKKSTSDI